MRTLFRGPLSEAKKKKNSASASSQFVLIRKRVTVQIVGPNSRAVVISSDLKAV